MKVALVSYDVSKGRGTGLYPPLHLCNLATALKNAGFETRVFDYAESFSQIDEFFQTVRDYQPNVVGLTSYTPYLRSFHKLTGQLRSIIPHAAMVVGGPHPSACPEWTLRRMPQFDYAMQGECDRSVVDFVEMLAGKKGEEDVPGLVYRKGAEIQVNDRDFIQNLDELPQIDRSCLDEYYEKRMYWDMAARGRLDMMITSRGCPYRCSFCFKVEPKCRWRSADHVLEEFDALKRRGITSIHVQDDAFTANKKRCYAVAEELIRRDYRFDIKVRSRANSIDEEMLRTLKAAGVRQIIYGFESGSQEVLDSMDKRSSVAMNRRAIDLTKKVGTYFPHISM